MDSEIFSLFANYSADEPFCVPYHPLHFAVSEVPIEATYLYDAVMIYARALTEALAQGVDPRDGVSIYGKIRNRSYHSIQVITQLVQVMELTTLKLNLKSSPVPCRKCGGILTLKFISGIRGEFLLWIYPF